jgi:hypothetical protein
VPDHYKYLDAYNDDKAQFGYVTMDPHVTLCITIRGDNDVVFTSTSFTEYCRVSGIALQTSTAYSGHCALAENAILTLRTMSCCMLNASHLFTEKFWLMAMVAAAHVYYRLPCAGRPAPL